jgi:alpha-beta hydrolase superfamily lysophospholipase
MTQSSPRIPAIVQWLKAHRKSSAAISVLLGFALLNLWAFRHAWAMTHFSNGGKSTIRPEEMSVLGRAAVLLTGVNLPRPSNDRTPADLNVTFETRRLRTGDGLELEAWYIAYPDPRATVVLFHGYGTSKSKLLNEAGALYDLRCNTLLVDFRGSGGSEGDTTTLGVYEAIDVAAACELARTLDPPQPLVLFGRSMGSVAILRAIAKYGVRPEGAILECPFDRLLGTVEHRFTAMSLPSFPSAELLVFWGGVQHGMNGFAHNPVDYASSVDCPVLLLHGERDKRVSVAEVEAVCEKLAGKKRLEIFPDVGHEACYRTRPDLWMEHVAAFLEDVTGDRTTRTDVRKPVIDGLQ